MGQEVSHRLLELFNVKARILLHDPPNKMCVLPGHEEVAREFRKRVLGDVYPLRLGVGDELVDIVKRADVLASSFDRWLISTLYATQAPQGEVFRYYRLHNILMPNKTFDLTEACRKVVDEVARELNDVLVQLTQELRNRGVDEVEIAKLAYTTLYFLLEVAWYSKGLNPSLADTRTPTHTVFDHLYAATSMANISLYEKPRGFLVLIDIPGVQNFVSAARKTGDFWAGSWILSQLTWRIIEWLIEEYGPDVVVSPTLRLNPYFFNFLIRKLEESKVSTEVTTKITTKICTLYVKVLEALGWKPLLEKLESTPETICSKRLEDLLGMLTLIPLIPATVLIILPPFMRDVGDLKEETIRNMIVDKYKTSWGELVKKVKDETKSQILRKLLEYAEPILGEPPTGLRVTIVNVGELYEKVVNCLTEGKGCKELGLKDDIRFRIVELGLGDPVKFSEGILWHVLVTMGIRLAARESPIPLPRPFWVWDEDLRSIRSIGDYQSLVRPGTSDWVPCSLCLDEPAIIHPRKTWVGRIESFNEEWLDTLIECLKLDKSREDVKRKLREIMRPGESLGPYCLLKRATYEAYSQKLREYFKVMSTDDLALINLDKAMYELKKSKQLKLDDVKISFEETVSKYGLTKDEINQAWELAELLVFPIFTEKELVGDRGRDLEGVITYSGLEDKLDYEMLRSSLSTALTNVCKKSTDIIKGLAKNLFHGYEHVIEDVSKVSRRLDLAERLCRVRTRYSIIKGDGDDIGKILNGEIGVLGLRLDDYVSLMLEEIRSARVDSAVDVLVEAYRKAVEVAKLVTGSDSRLIVSPTLTSTISAALQITALRDIVSIISGNGFPVYVGGDDVLALAPLETWPMIVGDLRANFWGGGDNLFHTASVDGNIIVVAQAIPTGRSFSVRVAELKDVMAAEITRALELLENVAKEAKWSGCAVSRKDTLVVSDSRSGVVIQLPLSLRPAGSMYGRALISRDIRNVLIQMMISLGFGLLSANLPEDVDRSLRSPLTNERVNVRDLGVENLRKLAEYALRRNIHVKEGSVDEAMRLALGNIDDILLYGVIGKDGLTLAENLVEYVRMVRGWI